MIYLNNNKINKLGGINRAYLNGRLIYQTYVEAEEPTSKTYVYVETNNQWELSTVDGGQGYTTFQSFSNKGQSVTKGALLRIRFFGFENFSFKYRSEGWSNYIYLCVGDVDVDLSSKVDTIRYNTTGVKYNTRGNATPEEWKNAEYSNLDPTVEHFIDVIYIKTYGTSFDEDRGFISLVTSETIEKWEASTTEYITVKNADNTYSFYTKEYKYISLDKGETWIPTSNSRQGETELEQSISTVDGYICENGNKYTKNELFVDLGGNLVGTQIYKTGDLIEEGAEDCQSIWITLTQDTPRDIPMQTFRIDATDPETDGYYFITFSSSPNYTGENASITTFSICPDEGTIYDNYSSKKIKNQTYIEGNIYEYTFSQVVYFAGAEPNAPLSQVQYQPL